MKNLFPPFIRTGTLLSTNPLEFSLTDQSPSMFQSGLPQYRRVVTSFSVVPDWSLGPPIQHAHWSRRPSPRLSAPPHTTKKPLAHPYLQVSPSSRRTPPAWGRERLASTTIVRCHTGRAGLTTFLHVHTQGKPGHPAACVRPQRSDPVGGDTTIISVVGHAVNSLFAGMLYTFRWEPENSLE